MTNFKMENNGKQIVFPGMKEDIRFFWGLSHERD
jgi:hypothetical protein